MPDYSRPSVDLERRIETDWQWGVTHTVRYDQPVRMLPGIEYNITVKVQRKVTEVDPVTTLAGLYARASRIARARCDRFTGADAGVDRWIVCHAWRTVPAGSSWLAFAVVMMGLMRSARGKPPGEPAPTAEALMTSGGATLEEMQHRAPQRASEVLVEFDHRGRVEDSAPVFMYSYAERVAADRVDSFEPFVRRAEHLARAHHALAPPGTAPVPSSIAGREWYLADDLVTVELHLKP